MKYRNGFVSNSSSSSFIVIGNNFPNNVVNVTNFVIGNEGETEFEWQHETYDGMDDRINFTWLQIRDSNFSQKKKEKLTNWLYLIIANYFSIKFKDISISKNIEGGHIDHQSSSREDSNIEMFESIETMKRFILCNDSYIECGNDND